MKIIHKHVSPAIAKVSKKDDKAFCLINKRKDFMIFYEKPQSRYDGFFVKTSQGYIKILAKIKINNPEPEEQIIDSVNSEVVRVYGDFSEKFTLSENKPSFSYELSSKQNVSIFLDIRKIFSSPEFGRNYEIIAEINNGLVIKYTDNEITSGIFVAIHTSGKLVKKQTWEQCYYPRDEKRGQTPSTLYEFNLGDVNAKNILFAYGETEKEALKNLENIVKPRIFIFNKKTKVNNNPDLETLYKAGGVACRKSMQDLTTENGVLAGLPWFTDHWSRDELLSIPVLEKPVIRKIIKKYIEADWPAGKIPVVIGHKELTSDSLGILCWAILITSIKLSKDENEKLKNKLLAAISELEKTENELGFIYSAPNESWMDSIAREGFLVETQAHYTNILQLAYKLTLDKKYKTKREDLIRNIREHYLLSRNLKVDRLGENEARPNILLAAFFAPELQTKSEWEITIDSHLPFLWLKWGGLSTISIKSPEFKKSLSNDAYHNGDSWFFINNITAIVLNDIDSKKYKYFIDELIFASTEEILWHNFIGRPGEVSLANKLDSWGCGIQAFSASTYLFYLNKLNIRKKI